jgi:menaquinol-cytochrome c reductase iron-sulfur subunit
MANRVTERPAATPPRTNEFGPPSPERRRFLSRLSLALSGVGALLLGVPVVGFLLGPLLRRQPLRWSAVGPVADYRLGETIQAVVIDPSSLAWAGLASRTAVWLRRTAPEEFIAFSVNCTHLGCPVRWLADAKLFLCPCHGGVFYEDGSVAAGPPEHPLIRYPVRVRGGQVEVQSGVSPIGED